MAFHFPLQAVFHYRQSVEHQQELRLRAANQQVARVRRLLDQIDARLADLRANQFQHLQAGVTSAELRFGLLSETSLAAQREQVVAEVARLQKLRDQQQRIFQHARREREILDSLRERQLHEYNVSASRRQQRQMDDLFLLRRAYSQRG
jgi:flagellar export protein FliJ